MRRGLILLLGAALAAAGGCAGGFDVIPAATIAARGATKAVQAARPISDSEEHYIGRAVAARILGTYRLSTDQALTLYVNEVGLTAARKSTRPETFRGYHFAVLDTPEPNAFACPGGLIFVTRGLMALCDNEDQLAAALAHEVAHVANKDGVNSISKARWTEVVTAMGTEAARQYGGVAGGLVTLFEGSIDDIFKTVVVNGYSRAAEEAADRDALATLSRAGYDSRALGQLLAKMQAKDQSGAGGIFKTHPPTAERLAKVQAAAGEGPPARDEEPRAKRFKSLSI